MEAHVLVFPNPGRCGPRTTIRRQFYAWPLEGIQLAEATRRRFRYRQTRFVFTCALVAPQSRPHCCVLTAHNSPWSLPRRTPPHCRPPRHSQANLQPQRTPKFIIPLNSCTSQNDCGLVERTDTRSWYVRIPLRQFIHRSGCVRGKS